MTLKTNALGNEVKKRRKRTTRNKKKSLTRKSKCETACV